MYWTRSPTIHWYQLCCSLASTFELGTQKAQTFVSGANLCAVELMLITLLFLFSSLSNNSSAPATVPRQPIFSRRWTTSNKLGEVQEVCEINPLYFYLFFVHRFSNGLEASLIKKQKRFLLEHYVAIAICFLSPCLNPALYVWRMNDIRNQVKN